jgi:hypothetical protein
VSILGSIRSAHLGRRSQPHGPRISRTFSFTCSTRRAKRQAASELLTDPGSN